MLDAATPSDLADLHALLGEPPPEGGTVPERYLTEPRDRYHGRAAGLLRPRTTEEVAAVVGLCATRGIGIIPWSGGTGLVGGQVDEAGAGRVVLSLERMRAIRAVMPEEDALVAEAGVPLAEVQRAAAEADRLFPLSMASEGSCCIGGNLATNAGGVQVLRYGNARDLTLGVEAVMPDGSIHHGLKALRKDNTGYDLRHLLIGSEGTLAVITAACLRLFPAPGETVTAMLAVPSPAAALELLHALRARLEAITAFELISGQGIGFVTRFYPDRADPLPGEPAWRVLMEVAGPKGGDLAARAETAFAGAFEAGLATDGAIAQSEAQRQAMWWMREAIPECNRRIGAISSHDMSVPKGRIPDFIEAGREDVAAIDPELRINCFGHLGDGNLHYNVFPPEGCARADYRNLSEAVTGALHARVHALGGSISAEHGIGRAKRGDLACYGDPAKLAAMRAIKAALDPGGIMNPGALLPVEDR